MYILTYKTKRGTGMMKNISNLNTGINQIKLLFHRRIECKLRCIKTDEIIGRSFQDDTSQWEWYCEID